MFILNGGVISWCSSKQSIVAGSTCEEKYIATSEAAHEGVCMKEVISDLGVIPSASGPMKIFCDNIEQFPWRRNPDQKKQTHQETLQLHP